MTDPTIGQVYVILKEGEKKHRLRVYLEAGDGGRVDFETTPQFTKREADYRAVQLSRYHGLTFGELPTHS